MKCQWHKILSGHLSSSLLFYRVQPDKNSSFSAWQRGQMAVSHIRPIRLHRSQQQWVDTDWNATRTQCTSRLPSSHRNQLWTGAKHIFKMCLYVMEQLWSKTHCYRVSLFPTKSKHQRSKFTSSNGSLTQSDNYDPYHIYWLWSVCFEYELKLQQKTNL